MCLSFTHYDPSRIFGNRQKIICYKVLSLLDGVFRAPFTRDIYEVPGTFISDRSSKEFSNLEEIREQVYRGVHVFLYKEDAQIFAEKPSHIFQTVNNGLYDRAVKYIPDNKVVVKVECDRDDFVACGEGYQAVFMMVETIEVLKD